MNGTNPIDLIVRVAEMLGELDIDYVLGGSMASSFFGEPRATADIDVAIRLDRAHGEALIARAGPEFYVPVASARRAIRKRDSFNLIWTGTPYKVDLFVLGRSLLDRRQMERRIQVPLPNAQHSIWVTSPEDQVLRKLTWYKIGNEASDQQWRDVIGLLCVGGSKLDFDYLFATAASLRLTRLLNRAIAENPSNN